MIDTYAGNVRVLPADIPVPLPPCVPYDQETGYDTAAACGIHVYRRHVPPGSAWPEGLHGAWCTRYSHDSDEVHACYMRDRGPNGEPGDVKYILVWGGE